MTRPELLDGTYLDYEFDFSLTRFDFARCSAWLAGTYWSPGIPPALVERGFRHSTVVLGAYRGGAQVGCLRVLSDQARFAYLLDVFVAPEDRLRGLARAMTRAVLDHPELRDVFVWGLGTRDAHRVYAPLGFAPLENPEYQMRLERPRPW